MQHTHKHMFNETTIWTFLFDGQNQLRILNPNIHAVIITWSANLKDGMLHICTIHSKEVQLISDNNPAETLQDIAQFVTDSSRNNHNIPQLVQDGGYPVKFYDWKTFLKQLFSHFLHSQHIIMFMLLKNHLELYLSRSTATLWKGNSDCLRNE